MQSLRLSRSGLTPVVLFTGIEASSPIANFTLGQATRYIIAGISAESAGDNCTIWVDEGVQCGGQVRPMPSSDSLCPFGVPQ